jgi:hypothetical protein
MRLKRLTGARVVTYAAIAAIVAAALVLSVLLGSQTKPMRVGLRQKSSANAAYTRARASLAVHATVSATAVDNWKFDRAPPPGWTVTAGARVASHNRQLRVVTGPTTEIQVRSPVLQRPRGEYRALVNAAVVSGGLYLGIEPIEPLSCEAAAYFDPKSTTNRRSWLPINFSTDGAPLRIVIGNWAATPHRSVWRLHQMRIIDRTGAVRAAARAKRYAAIASALVPESSLINFTPWLKWSFGYKVPSDWYTTPGVMTSRVPSRSSYFIRTNPDRYGYVFKRLIRLPAGRYFWRVNGKILKGGLSIGAVDFRKNQWIAQHFYWYGQADDEGNMGVSFYLRRERVIKLVLANWSLSARRSEWLIHDIQLDDIYG